MKILILNGSPRRDGNTAYAVGSIADAITKNTEHDVEIVNIAELKVGGCTACDACRKNGGDCVMKDDTKAVIDKVYASDAVVFASPVYWMGISAQLKALLDKFYSKSGQFKAQNKKLGVVAVGADGPENRQYGLIDEHFDCVCKYLGWEKIFGYFYSAGEPDGLRKSGKAAKELSEAWKLI
ncbi:MAG: flavodoxin family protein [Oscillospiraceae bacterium]|nr:flavodoxin family protein [Oscillospiraceae bacterium]